MSEDERDRVLEELHKAYRDIDFFDYETKISRGIAAGADATKERKTNESN